jgi:hypothetical protein
MPKRKYIPGDDIHSGTAEDRSRSEPASTNIYLFQDPKPVTAVSKVGKIGPIGIPFKRPPVASVPPRRLVPKQVPLKAPPTLPAKKPKPPPLPPTDDEESPVVVKTPKTMKDPPMKDPPKWKPTLDRKGFEVDAPGSQPKSGPTIGVKAGLVDVSDDEAAVSEQDPNLVIAFLQQKISGSDLLLGDIKVDEEEVTEKNEYDRTMLFKSV